MDIVVPVSEAVFFALETVIGDPQEWVANLTTSRAESAVADLKAKPSWMQAAMAVMQAGGNPMDDAQVLLKGRDLGLFIRIADVPVTPPLPDPGLVADDAPEA